MEGSQGNHEEDTRDCHESEATMKTKQENAPTDQLDDCRSNTSACDETTLENSEQSIQSRFVTSSESTLSTKATFCLSNGSKS